MRPGRLVAIAGWLCVVSMLALQGPGVKLEPSPASRAGSPAPVSATSGAGR